MEHDACRRTRRLRSNHHQPNYRGYPVGNFTVPHAIPTTYTKVAYRNSATDFGESATGANFTAKFDAYISYTQTAGTYVGKVKFLLIHPNTYAPDHPFYLQEVSSWASAVTLGQEVNAIDARDDQVYKVKRLKMNASGTESALWTSNLNLGAEPLIVSSLSSSNTNLDSNVSPIAKATFESWIKSSGSESYTDPELIPLAGSDAEYGWEYGTLYNYAAASAGTYVYPEGEGTGNATSDLCPSSWRLPTGGSSGEYGQLMTGYGGSASFMYASSTPTGSEMGAILRRDLGFSFAGYFTDFEPYSGTGGYYWSSTRANGTDMYQLFFDSTYVAPVFNRSRSDGQSVRCTVPLQTLTVAYGTGVASVIIDNVSYSNGDVISFLRGSTHTINMTFQENYDIDNWSATAGTIGSASTTPTTFTMGSSNATLTANGKSTIATCTKRYALQNADGTYPAYTTDTTEQVTIGTTCSYEKSVADYQTQSTSGTMTADGLTLDLQLPRNTYTLTVNKNNSYISSVTGAGTKRWGEVVSISATASSGNEFTSWSVSSGISGSFANANNASTTYTMPKGNSTIYANGKASKIYMQNLTNSQCATLASSSAITVYDRRDESDYTVRYLNNQCWMTQNLRITGTITAKDSNNVQWSNFTSPASFNVSQYDLVTDGAYGGRCSPDWSSSVCSHYYSGDTDTGGKPTAWYNYTAATAGSIITGGSNSTAASSDICPAGWRLPTNTEQSNLKTAISSNVSVFSPVYGGYCYNGSIAYPSTYALWWSATASDGTNRYSLSYNYGSLDTASLPRFVGFYVRCVRSS